MATPSIPTLGPKTEPAQKSYQRILEQEISEGLKELDRGTAGLFTISQVFFVGLITTAIGICHLHHAILGTGEVLAAVYSKGDVTLRHYGFFLIWATLGKIAGGYSLWRY